VLEFGILILFAQRRRLRRVWNFSIVIWDFSAVFGKANRFYLNQLETDFDVSPGGFEIFFSLKLFCVMVPFYFFGVGFIGRF
jgi:hypothetical protein